MGRPLGTIKAAKLSNSPRLQRLQKLLSDGREYSTLDIIHEANICAVNSAVAELRENGFSIECRKMSRNQYLYRMIL